MSEKEQDKQEQPQQDKKRPTHSVSFARINGRDEKGHDVLGPARQVGSIWPRSGAEGDGILRFDHVPEELRAQGGGVLFVRQILEKKNDPERER